MQRRRSIALLAVTALVASHAVRTAAGTAGASALAAQNPPHPAWSKDAYRVDWEEAHVPQEAATNVVLAIPVALRNGGNRLWPASEVLVAYHWFRDDKLVLWDGDRTPLPRDLRAGGRASLAVRVRTPAEPGAYVLQITLVHEDVSWFENQGASTLIRPIVVGTTTVTIGCGRSPAPCTAAP